MYYIYELDFEDGSKYIGCTNNITRRRAQHNANSKSRSSRLGVYLNASDITLTDSDFIILESHTDRLIALQREREIAKDYAFHGTLLHNDNYSSNCTRAGVKTHDTSKAYVIIDFAEHTATHVVGLKPYCETMKLDYKLLQRTVKGDRICYNRYKAFFSEDWESVEDKDFYLSGRILQANAEKWMQNHVKAASKEYEVRFPDGHTEIIKNLDQFARDHNLTSGTLHATFKKNKPTKGFQVVRRI